MYNIQIQNTLRILHLHCDIKVSNYVFFILYEYTNEYKELVHIGYKIDKEKQSLSNKLQSLSKKDINVVEYALTGALDVYNRLNEPIGTGFSIFKSLVVYSQNISADLFTEHDYINLACSYLNKHLTTYENLADVVLTFDCPMYMELLHILQKFNTIVK